VHLGDVGALVALPGLAAFGVVLGVSALRTGSLSRPIFLHAGFNLTALLLSFVDAAPT
jgi:membrane protease YdiL (CAAX protease family)